MITQVLCNANKKADVVCLSLIIIHLLNFKHYEERKVFLSSFHAAGCFVQQ